jgi:uncharacterized membrane protein
MDYLKREIRKVQDPNLVYYPTASTVRNIHSGMDHFPYTKFFRGDYKSNTVNVYDRMAGFTPLRDCRYQPRVIETPNTQPTYCWEAPCSVIYPCGVGKLDRKIDVLGGYELQMAE